MDATGGRRRRQLNDEVATYLREAIMAGELAPGSSVRAEVIGEQLDVSATPVREALQTLRAEGFLESVPRKGFRVAPLVSDDVRDIFEAHALIAGELTARAAINATDAQIEHLASLSERIRAASDRRDHETLEQLNHEFHKQLYRSAGSSRLLRVLSTLARYVPRAFYSSIEGWPEITVADHAAVLDAVVARDDQAARDAMERHIRNAGDRLADHFASRQPAASPA